MPDSYYDSYFQQYGAEAFGDLIDWRWLKAQGLAESNLRPGAVSPVGARGVMQLMPGTSKEMAGILGIEDTPFVPDVNIRMGVHYLRRCLDIWKAEHGIERLRFAFGSYNAGAGHIISAQKLAQKAGLATDVWPSIAKMLPSVTGKHAEETITYVARIERIYTHMTGSES